MVTGVLTTSFPRHPGDYAGCFVEDAVRAVAAGGDTVEVIAAGDGRGGGDEDRPDLLPRIRVSRVPAGAGLFYAAGAPEALERAGAATWAAAARFSIALAARARARASRWDRVIAHWLVPSALAAPPGRPLSSYAHSGDVALLERLPGGAALGRAVARRSHELVFASADLRARFERLTGLAGCGRVAWTATATAMATATRPPPAPRMPADRALARQRLGLPPERTLVLGVGRLVPIKGFDLLVRAAALAAGGASFGPTTVVVLGDGPERARLAALARALGVDLRLPGFVPRGDVAGFMAAADLYVQPSRRLPGGRTEGLPVATIEALDAGLPVVASASGGLAELPRVRLVPAGDPHLLAAAIVTAV